MGEAKRRRKGTRQAFPRSLRRAAILRRRFGDAPLDLCLFPLSAIHPPASPADLPLAVWRLQAGVEALELQGRGELFCVICDGAIAVDPPPLVGFVRADDPNSELGGFAVCEACLRAADSFDEVKAMVGEAFGGVVAPVSPHN
jgi:hypothetical protein